MKASCLSTSNGQRATDDNADEHARSDEADSMRAVPMVCRAFVFRLEPVRETDDAVPTMPRKRFKGETT